MASQGAAINPSSATNIETGTIIDHMAGFDLTAPWQVNVIFEDSDEDNNENKLNIKQETCNNSHKLLSLPVIKRQDKIEFGTTNQIKTKALENVAGEHGSISDSVYLLEDEESTTNTEKTMVIIKDNLINETDIDKASEQNNNLEIKLEERSLIELRTKKVVDQNKGDVNNEKEKNVVQRSVSECHSAHDFIEGTNIIKATDQINIRKRRLEEQASPELMPKHFVVQNKGAVLNEGLQTICHPSVVDCNSAYVTPTSAIYKTNNFTQTDTNTEILGIYISKLLQSLSEYIINVLETYCWYNRMKTNSQALPNAIETSKNYFLRVKQSCFTLSYSTVANIILPQEDNQTFINSFLEDTIKLSHKYKKPMLLETQVKPVFLELVAWVKQKHALRQKHPILRHSLTSMPNDHPVVTSHQNSENIFHSQKPVLKEKTITKENKDSTVSSNVLFSSGEPGREISITIPPWIHQLQSNPNSNTSLSTQNVSNTNLMDYNSVQQQNLNLINHPISHHQINNQMHHDPTNSTLKRTESIYTNNFYQNNFSTDIPTTRTAMHSLRIPHSNACQPYGIVQSNAAQSLPFTFQSTNEQLNTETNRSVSTDSGFVSPLYFNSSTEIMNKDCVEKNQTPKSALPPPVIEHITSLHPNVLLNTVGSCYVCGTQTKKMCIGCYARYYCSYLCQRSDWQLHMLNCKNP